MPENAKFNRIPAWDKDLKKTRGLKGVLMLFFLAILVIGIYYRLSNKPAAASKEPEVIKITPVEEALQRNMKTNYPNTPKEVVKYFAEITQCYYNETFEDETLLEALADRMLLLYDDELVSYKTHEDYILDLKADIYWYNENGYKISSFAPSASTDVEYFTQDGYEWARLWCIFTIKSGKYYKPINEVFILRKDENSHWRIYGWDKVDE